MTQGKILITSYYRTGNNDRDYEIDHVLIKNLNSNLFEKIILFCDSNCRPLLEDNRLEFIDTLKRSTYLDFFKTGNLYENKIIIIANSDIFFDESINLSEKYVKNGEEILALTRYEYNYNKYQYKEDFKGMIMGCDSQDSWVYLSPLYIDNMDIDFGLGVPGCDNRIAYELSKNYIVKNPSFSIRTYHFHESNVRNYNPNNRLNGNYLQVHME
jgi:hypothetical protein